MPGERVLWSGSPQRGLLLTARDALIIPFSLLWCGFAIFWEASVLRSGAPPFFYVFGALFVLVGMFMVIGRFAFDSWVRNTTEYFVTNRRILVSRRKPVKALISLNLDKLSSVTLSESRGGRGTIRFGQNYSIWAQQGFGGWIPALDATPQFLAIDNARDVFDRIQRLTAATA
jgi:hypothetical protein